VGYAEFFDLFQSGIREVVELPDTVFLLGAPRLVGGICISKKSGKNLINDYFLGFHRLGFLRLWSLAG
jgi:hypothetical protein